MLISDTKIKYKKSQSVHVLIFLFFFGGGWLIDKTLNIETHCHLKTITYIKVLVWFRHTVINLNLMILMEMTKGMTLHSEKFFYVVHSLYIMVVKK